MGNNNARNTNARDAAVRFWGNKCEKRNKGLDATAVVFTDSTASDGHMIISRDAAQFRDYTPNPEGRISDCGPEKVREVLDHYLTDSADVEAPQELHGHMRAGHSRFFAIGAAGRWMSFVSNNCDVGMHIEDGAETAGARSAFCMRFDARVFAKIFQRFSVKSVEFVAPTKKGKQNGFARFHVSYRGEAFTVVLLCCYDNDLAYEAGELAARWHADDMIASESKAA